MPRNLRVEYPGAIYHIMSSEVVRERVEGLAQDVFLDDVDRQDVLKTLAKTWRNNGPRNGVKNELIYR